MGVDQLVTGGDVDDPVVDSLTSDSVNTGEATIGGRGFFPLQDFDKEIEFAGEVSKTLTLDEPRESVIIGFIIQSQGETKMRFNGVSSNSYSWVRNDGNETSSSDGVVIGGGNSIGTSGSITATLYGELGFTGQYAPSPNTGEGLNEVDFLPNAGICSGVTSDITEIEVLNTNGKPITGRLALSGGDA